MSNNPGIDQTDLAALRAGDSSALNRLIARWQHPLHNFAYRYCQNGADSEDLVAQTFVRLYQQRERLRADTNLSAWLFTTLTNLCHNHHRWKKRHPTVALAPRDGHDAPGPSQESLPSEELSPHELLEKDESAAAVRAAINQLPHDLKVALLLHHYDHRSYREIAAITGCSERGIETRLYRARLQLRQRLGTRLPTATPP